MQEDDLAPLSSPAWTEWGDRSKPLRPPPEDRYEKSGELGRGGMGVVTSARDTWLDREVAIKRPRPAHIDHSDHIVREARITARLAHPGIVPVHDFGTDEEGPYFTMPVLDGNTFRDLLEDPEHSSAYLVRVIASVCGALAFAHARGFVHRDLKPENILIGAYGGVRVLDWGIALDPDSPDTSSAGTPGFRSPEQAAANVVTPAADVYAVGRMLSLVVKRSTEPLPALSAIIRRATAEEYTARYPDAEALGQELGRWLDGARVHAHRYSTRELLTRALWRIRYPLGGILLTVLTVLTAATSWVVTIRAERDRAISAEASADRSLSISLWQQAEAWRRADHWQQAEVLALNSLALVDSPTARGILMGTLAETPLTLLSDTALPCPDPLLSQSGSTPLTFACVGGSDTDPSLSLFGAGRDPLWQTTATPPELDRWSGGYQAGHLYGDLLLLVREPNILEVWRDGARIAVHPMVRLQLASGPTPAIVDTQRVGLIDRDGSLHWGPPTCERIESAWVTDETVVIGCVQDSIWVGAHATPSEHSVPTSPSAVTLVGDQVVIGTFDGKLLSLGGPAIESGVGAPRRLVPYEDLVLVLGEHGTPRLWNPTTRAFLGRLDARPGRVVPAGDSLVTAAQTLRTYALTHPPSPVALDDTVNGGTNFISATETHLLTGGATGAVRRWNRETGAVEEIGTGCGNVAKAGVFLGDTLVYSQLGCGLIANKDGETQVLQYSARRVATLDDNLVLALYSNALQIGPLGDLTLIPLPTSPVSIGVGAGEIWTVDSLAQVWEVVGDEAQERFSQQELGALAVQAEGILLSEGTVLRARDRDGTVRWTWEAPSFITVVSTEDEAVFVGDIQGGLHVLDPDGRLRATVSAHTRRVSAITPAGPSVYTASWDGWIRRWDVMPALEPVEGVFAVAEARSSIPLETVLAQLPPR